jgi:hypothetical protein
MHVTDSWSWMPRPKSYIWLPIKRDSTMYLHTYVWHGKGGKNCFFRFSLHKVGAYGISPKMPLVKKSTKWLKFAKSVHPGATWSQFSANFRQFFGDFRQFGMKSGFFLNSVLCRKSTVHFLHFSAKLFFQNRPQIPSPGPTRRFFSIIDRGEVVPQGWILSPGGEVIPWGEILCSPLHFSKQWRVFTPGGEQRGEHSP